LAVHADAKRFIGQPCCFHAMSNVWYSMIDIDKTGLPWLLVTIFTGGLSASLTINFRKNMATDVSKVISLLDLVE
jgi:Mg/Co/Ni transporter MgtE